MNARIQDFLVNSNSDDVFINMNLDGNNIKSDINATIDLNNYKDANGFMRSLDNTNYLILLSTKGTTIGGKKNINIVGGNWKSLCPVVVPNCPIPNNTPFYVIIIILCMIVCVTFSTLAIYKK